MPTFDIDAPAKLDLKLDTAPHPEQHWEGCFDYDDDGDPEQFHIIAHLRFGGGLFEGAGKVAAKGSEESLDVALSGETNGQDVSFAMWISEEEVRFQHFSCTGTMSADETAMDGDHSYPCWDPENCGCEGGSGTFEMRRVEGQAREPG